MPEAKKVREIFEACLSTPETDTVKWVHGIFHKQSFDTAAIEAKRANIVEQLKGLPESFYKEKGGGWSFLNGCLHIGGGQWADLHADVDALFCLGKAIGVVKYIPEERRLWASFPGGMPYVIIDLTAK